MFNSLVMNFGQRRMTYTLISGYMAALKYHNYEGRNRFVESSIGCSSWKVVKMNLTIDVSQGPSRRQVLTKTRVNSKKL